MGANVTVLICRLDKRVIMETNGFSLTGITFQHPSLHICPPLFSETISMLFIFELFSVQYVEKLKVCKLVIEKVFFCSNIKPNQSIINSDFCEQSRYVSLHYDLK